MSDVLHHELLSGGDKCSFVLPRHHALTLTAGGPRCAGALLAFRARRTQERYNMPDTQKAQHTAFLSTGRVLLSDMGRVLLSVTANIGGAYMCIYGMEGPGGYQFVGRTVPVWNSATTTPALLRNFDRIRWYPVGAEELLDLRADCRAGRWAPRIADGVFDGAAYSSFLAGNAAAIAGFRTTQRAAFAKEREAWGRS